MTEQLTPDGFRKLEQDIIFIAGSQDVQSVRQHCERVIRKALDDLASNSFVTPYSWDLEYGEDGMDQRWSMQQRIPKPSDEFCLGVICLLGERIGHPLPSALRLETIPEIETWTTPDHRYRLLHPWPDDFEEQQVRLDGGCYPLTGTVFEFLEARGSRKPVWLGVLAESAISPDDPEVQLNGNRFRSARTSRMTPVELERWMRTNYLPQTAAVHNFVCALVKNGIDPHTSDDELRAGRAVRAFVIRNIIEKNFTSINPYKLFAYYSVDDHSNFFGRDGYTEMAISRLRQRFETPGAPNAVSIAGVSGCGKSSLLHAGILHGLMETENRGLYQTVAFRPEAFVRPDGQQKPVISALLQVVDRGTSLRLSATDVDTAENHPNAPKAAVELLCGLLAQTRDGRGRLVIGIDQFEEIVDQLTVKARRAYWQPLIDFIEIAAKSPSLGVVYTLESSRRPALERLQLGHAFAQAEPIELNDNSDVFLTEIIEKPFKKEGYPLSTKVVAKLKENARALMPKDVQRIESSLLPLITLKLAKLFDKIQNTRQPIEPGLSLELSFDQESEDSVFVKLSDIGKDFDFEKDISELAGLAWRRAGKEEQIDLEALDHFLVLFVGVGGAGGSQIQLLTPSSPSYSDERKLVESFRQARLLVEIEGRLRLVHEAVIRFWPAAREWFEKRRSYLQTQEWMRREAEAWTARVWLTESHPELGKDDGVTRRKINAAAEILAAHLRLWSLAETTDQLRDDPLYAYCKDVFLQSRTPSEPIMLVDGAASTHAHCAASYGLTELLQIFHEIDPESLDRPSEKLGRKPLAQAAWNWRPEAVSYLLSKGVDPIGKDKKGWPAIGAPVVMGNMKIFKLLLRASKGQGLDCPGGGTLLHLCARHDRVDIAKILIDDDYGFSPEARDERHQLPLHHAAITGKLRAFEFFRSLSDVTSRADSGLNSLHFAAYFGNMEIASSLLTDPGFRTEIHALTEAHETALHLSCKGRHAEMVRRLTPFFDPNQPIPSDDPKGNRPIHLALRTTYQELVDQDDVLATVRVLLEDKRTDPNIPDRLGRTPLALAQEYPSVQRLLLSDHRIKPMEPIEPDGVTPLFLAARLGYWQGFRRLAERAGVDVRTYRDSQGNTLLHLLAERNAPRDLLSSLVEMAGGETLNALNKAEYTPILTALKNSQWHLADQLLATGKLEIAKRPPASPSALGLALSGRAKPDMLGRLLAAGPQELEASDLKGWTLLHQACGHQRTEWLQALEPHLAFRPELWSIPDGQGRRPIDLLRRSARNGWPGAETGMDWPAPKTWDTGLVWEPLDVETRAELVSQVNPIAGQREIGEATEITVTGLSFYQESVHLLRLRDMGWSPDRLALYYLRHEGNLYRLNGTSPPIHEVNAKQHDEHQLLTLTADNAADYLRFFCFFVRGKEGPFLITESVDQEELPRDLTAKERTAIADACHPVWFSCVPTVPEAFFCAALVYYSNVVFAADFKIYKTGMIEMLDDEPVASDLSQRIHSPID